MNSVTHLAKGSQPNHTENMINVQLYGKKDCHLCDLAKEILYRLREEIPFDLQEVDIESSEDLYEKFKERIPVVFVDGKQAFTYKIHERRLRRILSSTPTRRRAKNRLSLKMRRVWTWKRGRPK